MNEDFYCDEVRPAFCEAAVYYTRNDFFSSSLYDYAFYHNYLGSGCNKCESDYVALLVEP